MTTRLHSFFKAIQHRFNQRFRPSPAQPAVDAVTLEIQRLEKTVADMLVQMPDRRQRVPVLQPASEYQKICDIAG